MGDTRSAPKKNNVLLVIRSLSYVTHGEEAPVGGELEPTCKNIKQLSIAIREMPPK